MGTSTTSTTTTAAIFDDAAIFAVSALVGFPTGSLLVDLNARRLGRGGKARILSTAAAAGFLAGAVLSALLGLGFLILYPVYFGIACALFLPLNLILAFAFARLARRDATRAQAAGVVPARRDARTAYGIGALAYLAVFLVGVVAIALRIALA